MIRHKKHYLGYIIAFVILLSPLFSFADDLYEARLDEGLKNTDPYSYVLIKKAQNDPSNAQDLLTDAIKYSPDLPAAYFEKAGAGFSFSTGRMFERLDNMIQGFKAYKRNFWWLFGISGLLFASSISSFIIVLVIIVFIRFFIDAPLLSHDIKEDPKKVLVVLSLIPLSFLGPLFFIIGTLLIFGLYFSKADKAVVYAAILFLVLSPFLLRLTNIFISASSPELKAIVAVNENRDNKYALTVLKGKNDFAAAFSYSLALKREGRFEEAAAGYKNLLSSYPDPYIYVNLGNCYAGMNDMAGAKDLYKKAVDIKPLASAYYNLSQTSRETLDFVKGEEYFSEATKLNSETISKVASTASRNPNRLIIDETLPESIMWKHAYAKSQNVIKAFPLNSIITGLIAVALGVVFSMINSRMKQRAYRCSRCNTIICGKCSKEILWGQMCSQCYKSLIKMGELDSRVRVAKLLEVQELQKRKRNLIKTLSFAPPGIAYIYAGKILIGSLFLWSFLFLSGLIALTPFFLTSIPLFSHNWLLIPAVALMVILYLVSNIAIRRRLSRGWL